MGADINPNAFAYVALFSWPIITVILYLRMNVVRATLWSILGAFLLLPRGTEVDLPLFPPLDKSTVSNLSAYFACWFVAGKRVRLLPSSNLIRFFLIVYLVSPFITALLNQQPIIAGPIYIKGMNYYDAFSAVIRQVLFMLPFSMGLTLFRTEKDLEYVFKILAVCGLLYSIPMLLEVRFSPQLNRWIYGYHPAQFVQNKRADSFRPVVFIGHGLAVAYFTMMSLVAAAILKRIRLTVANIDSRIVFVFLGVMLLLCKSLASFVYAIIILSMMFFFSPVKQVKFSRFLAIIIIAYPLIRTAELFPLNDLVDVASLVSNERAHSLNYRFENEEILLNKAKEHLLFGWGSWGRNRVYDLVTGRDLSVTDGRWIITLGMFGLIGYFAEFGLLILPIMQCRKAVTKSTNSRERFMLGGLSLLLAINMLDLLPNSTIMPFSWMLAGILIGYAEALKIRLKVPANLAVGKYGSVE